MKDKLISTDDLKKLHPALRGKHGDLLLKIASKVAGVDKANRVYDDSKHLEGLPFVNHLLDGLGIKRIVDNPEALQNLPEGAFITVSNHPYGHVDGITAISIMGQQRNDYKMMVNWLLSNVDCMEDYFIGVNPFQGGKLSARSSVAGVKQCMAHLKEGHPLGFFPAGAVSKNKITHIEDREWQPTVVKLIKNARVPVVPMYFTGSNSWFFNFLDLIDWRLRSLRLAHEFHNKQGHEIHIRFGKVITPEEQDQYKDVKAFGQFLKDKTYELAGKKYKK